MEVSRRKATLILHYDFPADADDLTIRDRILDDVQNYLRQHTLEQFIDITNIAFTCPNCGEQHGLCPGCGGPVKCDELGDPHYLCDNCDGDLEAAEISAAKERRQ